MAERKALNACLDALNRRREFEQIQSLQRSQAIARSIGNLYRRPHSYITTATGISAYTTCY